MALVKCDRLFADRIAKLCYEKYSSLGKTGKPCKENEWTLLAGFIIEKCGLLTVVSIATGTKCIGENSMMPDGTILNDSHAEVLARRCFLRYVYQQFQILERDGNGSSEVFCISDNPDNGGKRYMIHPEVTFHMFTSHVPCGDASIIPKTDVCEGNVQRDKKNVERSNVVVENGEHIFSKTGMRDGKDISIMSEGKGMSESNITSKVTQTSLNKFCERKHSRVEQNKDFISNNSKTNINCKPSSNASTSMRREKGLDVDNPCATPLINVEDSGIGPKLCFCSSIKEGVGTENVILGHETCTKAISLKRKCENSSLSCNILDDVSSTNIEENNENCTKRFKTGEESVVDGTVCDKTVPSYFKVQTINCDTRCVKSVSNLVIENLDLSNQAVGNLSDYCSSGEECPKGTVSKDSSNGLSSVEIVSCGAGFDNQFVGVPILDIHRTGAKCLSNDPRQDPGGSGVEFHVVGAVRTKPGRGSPTLSVSCSDKIARWIALGVQGALLTSLLAKPIHLSSVTVGGGGQFSYGSLFRALISRTGTERRPRLLRSNLVFEKSRCLCGGGPDTQPCPTSVMWSNVPISPIEIAVQGYRQGSTKKTKGIKRCLSVCKRELFKEFLAITGNRFRGQTYRYAKESSKDYIEDWKKVKHALGAWTLKPSSLLEFTISNVELQS